MRRIGGDISVRKATADSMGLEDTLKKQLKT